MKTNKTIISTLFTFSLLLFTSVAALFSRADGVPESWITDAKIDQYAQNNLASVREPIRGIVVTHRWCGEVAFAPKPDAAFYPDFGAAGIVVLAPYQNPWCWMNDAAVRFTDAVVDRVLMRYGLPEDTPVVSAGVSMGGVSAINYAMRSRHHVVSALANCSPHDLPAQMKCDVQCARTLVSAFADAPEFEAALRVHSPLYLAQARRLPRIPYGIYHATRDPLVPLEPHSAALVGALKENGYSVDFRVSDKKGHTAYSDENLACWNAALTNLLDRPVRPLPVAGTNTCLVPVPQYMPTGYDWFGRHEKILRLQKAIDPEIAFIGDSITHFWAGVNAVGEPLALGEKPGWLTVTKRWLDAFGERRAMDMGFGFDRIQNVLWRLDHGELDGTHPKVVVLLIGTNNLGGFHRSPANTAEEIAEGTVAVVNRLHRKVPDAKVVVMAIFPRGKTPAEPMRATIRAANARTRELLADDAKAVFLDIGAQLLDAQGEFVRPLTTGDGVHLGDAGYEVWRKALEPHLEGAWK